ncbi:MAG: DUF3040 domain-containing protein [Frankiaceae bacterium]
MPLSDHEQRLLEQIERALYAEDPKFASTVRSSDLRHYHRRRVVRGALVCAIGLGAVVGGVVGGFVALVAVGAIVAVLGAVVAATAWRRARGDVVTQVRRARARSDRLPFRARMEERWQRRWDERNL